MSVQVSHTNPQIISLNLSLMCFMEIVPVLLPLWCQSLWRCCFPFCPWVMEELGVAQRIIDVCSMTNSRDKQFTRLLDIGHFWVPCSVFSCRLLVSITIWSSLSLSGGAVKSFPLFTRTEECFIYIRVLHSALVSGNHICVLKKETKKYIFYHDLLIYSYFLLIKDNYNFHYWTLPYSGCMEQ